MVNEKLFDRLLEDQQWSFTEPMVTHLRKAFEECGQVNRWIIEEIEISHDSVALVLELPPTISVDEAVKWLKSGSEKKLYKLIPDFEQFTLGRPLWHCTYVAETLDGTDLEDDLGGLADAVDALEKAQNRKMRNLN